MRSNNHNNISIVNFITTGRIKSMPIVMVATQVMASLYNQIVEMRRMQ